MKILGRVLVYQMAVLAFVICSVVLWEIFKTSPIVVITFIIAISELLFWIKKQSKNTNSQTKRNQNEKKNSK